MSNILARHLSVHASESFLLKTLDTTHRSKHITQMRSLYQAKPIGRLVVVSSGRCRPSTSTLSTLWSTTVLMGTLILELASRLDAFSGYPFRT